MRQSQGVYDYDERNVVLTVSDMLVGVRVMEGPVLFSRESTQT